MHILMIYLNKNMASSRIRIIDLAPYLEKRGFQCTVCSYPESLDISYKNFDAIVIQKKLISWLDYYHWRRVKLPIFFDFDDAIFIRNFPKHGSYNSYTRKIQFGRATKLADYLICGNHYLSGFCPTIKRKLIAPSPIPHNVPVRDYNYSNPILRVGWVGGGGNLHTLDTIKNSLIKLNRDITFELHIISDCDYSCDGVSVVNHRWSLEEQDKMVATFDVGLMPLLDDPWSLGKCSYKLLQYMAAGVASIGSDVGMNRDLIEHGENGFLSTGGDDWYAVLKAILSDGEARRRIGQTGRETILKGFTYEHYADKWAEFLLSC